MLGSTEQFVERVLARVRAAPVDLALLPPGAASASIYGGGAGVAFFLHEAARLRGDDDLLLLARRWCAAARKQAERATAHAWHDLHFGVIHGEVGLSYVEALLDARETDPAGVSGAVARIEQATSHLRKTPRVRPTELLGGAAGVACAARSLHAKLPAPTHYDGARAALQRVRAGAVDLLLERHGAQAGVAPGDPLGFAHGLAGELWALVAALGADHDVVRRRLVELAALHEVDESELVYWLPSVAGQATSFLTTLCSGMPGHTILWCDVARQTRDEASLELARRSAQSTAVLVTALPTLCCGLAGQAVALQRYADVSGDTQFARRADARLSRATRFAEESPDLPLLGLWRGMLGVALVAMGRLHGGLALPCIEA